MLGIEESIEKTCYEDRVKHLKREIEILRKRNASLAKENNRNFQLKTTYYDRWQNSLVRSRKEKEDFISTIVELRSKIRELQLDI